ncbi:unnamed protein product, partial [Mesorhabditis belari]|uniref:Major facilitator superfamily (MFS) profile domain-containing protein n=1 Tax=Mesorhabditis belari TaxID=2138241 RepID=A0AAF3J759_9BILA
MKTKSRFPLNTENKTQPTTPWSSMWIASLVQFFCAIQFTIYFSSLWPYLLQLDASSKERQFGHITAIYSLGQALSLPFYGFWSNRIKNTKIPVLAGLFMMTVGNTLYLSIPIFEIQPYIGMMVSRLVVGLGAGIISPLRAYAIQGSTKDDRSRAISLNTGGFSLGILAGPGFQILFTPLDYPGYQVFGKFLVNMYTGPAMMGILVNLLSALMMIFAFKDSRIGIYQVEKQENPEHERFFALPKFDLFAAFVCIMTRFVQMFVITNIETIGSPLSMTIFAWDRAKAVYYNSLIHIGFGAIGLAYYASNTVWDFGKNLNHRLWTIIGILLLTLFHILTYPWWFLPGKIQYQQEFETINGTLVKIDEPVGCRQSFDWARCKEFSFLAGSSARLIGPLFVASLFESSGIGNPWIIVIVISLLCALAWVLMYRRMVPLKMSDEMKVGDQYRNKFGKVEKF